jgi:hypothetical protein
MVPPRAHNDSKALTALDSQVAISPDARPEEFFYATRSTPDVSPFLALYLVARRRRETEINLTDLD